MFPSIVTKAFVLTNQNPDSAQFLVVTFAPGKEALRRQLDRPQNLEFLARCAGDIAHRTVRVRLAEGDAASGTAPGPAPRVERQEKTAAGADAATAPRNRPRPDGRTDRSALMKEATSDPGVKRLLREFGAQVVDIRPLSAGKPEPEDG